MTRPMKDSGIEWIGEIPQGWSIQKTQFLFEVVNGATPRSGNSDYWEGCIPWVTPADFITDRKYITEPRRYITEKGLNSCGTRLVPKGSIIVSTRAPIGSVAMAAFQLCTNQGCKSLVRKGDLCPDYYYYFLSVMDSALNALGEGTTFAELSSSNLGNFYLPVPTIKEQQDISNYLDSECAQIDKVIASKQKTNELLKEHRQSIIYEAVTKGLNRNAPMKDSGIEWIGKIPLRWGVRKLKYCVSQHVDKVKPTNHHEPLMYLGLEHIEQQSGKLEWNYSPIYNFKGDTIKFNRGDILFGKLRPYLAKCYLARNEGRCSSEFLVLTPVYLFEGQYVAYGMLSKGFINYVDSSTFGAKMPRVSWDFVGNTGFPVPPKKEQKEIADYLDLNCEKIDRLMQANYISIEKLTEYRQSIIYEAVTGKAEIIS